MTWLTNKKSEDIGQTSLPSAWEPLTIKVSGVDFERAKLIVAKYESKAQGDKFESLTTSKEDLENLTYFRKQQGFNSRCWRSF